MSYQDYVLQNQDKFKAPLITPTSGKLRQSQFGTGQSRSPVDAYKPITMGQKIPDILSGRVSTGTEKYLQGKTKNSSVLAKDVLDKSPLIKTNEYGVVDQEPNQFSSHLTKQLGATSAFGKSALQAEESKAQWQQLQNMQDMSAGIVSNISPGASGDNPGAKAVALAMQAYNNKTPYAWGGDSLTRGVDCSGLVQQVYAKLGIPLPRVTYEQAKSGKRVPLDQLLPGDLLFFNSGSSDPNGIGTNGHVGIYIGNGQMVDARNRQYGIKVGSIYTQSMGGPTSAVRPW